MKKFLAILLSVIMLFTLGVAAFADDDADAGETTTATMPDNIGKQEGKIVLSIDNTYIEASQTYTIPIRLYADYATQISADAEKLYIGASGLQLMNAMANYATITSIVCTDLISEENQIEIGYNEEEDENYFTFAIDKADFGTMLSTPNEGVIVGYVTIETNETVPEDYGVDFGQLGLFGTYELDWTVDGADSCTAGYFDSEGNFTEIPSIGESAEIVYDTACFYHTPKIATWQEKLKDWAKSQGLLFLGFFITVLSVLEELLKQA